MKTNIYAHGTKRQSKTLKTSSVSRRQSLHPETILAKTQNLRVKISGATLGILIGLMLCAVFWRPEVAPAILYVIGIGLWKLAGTGTRQ